MSIKHIDEFAEILGSVIVNDQVGNLLINRFISVLIDKYEQFDDERFRELVMEKTERTMKGKNRKEPYP